MTQEHFEEQKLKWLKEWYNHWRLLDIDFETYMVMSGMDIKEFKKKIKAYFDKEKHC